MIFEIGILVILLISSIEDIKNKEIPIWEIAACGAVSVAGVVYGCIRGDLGFWGIVLSLLPGAFLLLLSLVTRQQVGYGDGLLVLTAGPAFGLYGMGLGLILAIFLSSFISLCLIAIKKAGKRARIPFVPFLTAGLGVMLVATI